MDVVAEFNGTRELVQLDLDDGFEHLESKVTELFGLMEGATSLWIDDVMLPAYGAVAESEDLYDGVVVRVEGSLEFQLHMWGCEMGLWS